MKLVFILKKTPMGFIFNGGVIKTMDNQNFYSRIVDYINEYIVDDKITDMYPRTLELIKLRYCERVSLEEIAKKNNITRERAQQIISKGIHQIRYYIDRKYKKHLNSPVDF
jgi:DNA-directed RNA polymerase sigma subunit (sigma70/sigma32)